MGSILEKNRGRKSRDTAPLSNVKNLYFPCLATKLLGLPNFVIAENGLLLNQNEKVHSLEF